jgi:hypothetical protein
VALRTGNVTGMRSPVDPSPFAAAFHLLSQ